MKYFLITLLFSLVANSVFSIQALAEKKEVERSTSLGTGLPTTNERYERKSLTPKPTKPPTTSYDFIEEEDEDKKVDATEEGDTMDKSNTTSKTDTVYEKYTGTDHFQSEKTDKKSTSQIEIASTTTDTKTTKQTPIVHSTEQALDILPQTGVQKNYWGIIGTAIIILGILLVLFFMRKKPNQNNRKK